MSVDHAASFSSSLSVSSTLSPWALCVAPMIDVTDRHCRYFHRLLAPHARLYTEMITTSALHYGDVPRLLGFDASEHPVALQLGGNEPAALAASAKLGQQWGYDEINLNCGCPSERVQKGGFGAYLMAELPTVLDGIKAMQDAVSVPVTVKHRLGLGYEQHYPFVQDFVGQLVNIGVEVFIVHARNAVLEGLSPKQNREVPPLRYDFAYQLTQDFPSVTFVLNGGLSTTQQCVDQLKDFPGVMLGRAAWHTPGILRELSLALWPQATHLSEAEIVEQMVAYAEHTVQQGLSLRTAIQAMLGWPHGKIGARAWRRTLSDAQALKANDPQLLNQAWATLQAQNPVTVMA